MVVGATPFLPLLSDYRLVCRDNRVRVVGGTAQAAAIPWVPF